MIERFRVSAENNKPENDQWTCKSKIPGSWVFDRFWWSDERRYCWKEGLLIIVRLATVNVTRSFLQYRSVPLQATVKECPRMILTEKKGEANERKLNANMKVSCRLAYNAYEGIRKQRVNSTIWTLNFKLIIIDNAQRARVRCNNDRRDLNHPRPTPHNNSLRKFAMFPLHLRGKRCLVFPTWFLFRISLSKWT